MLTEVSRDHIPVLQLSHTQQFEQIAADRGTGWAGGLQRVPITHVEDLARVEVGDQLGQFHLRRAHGRTVHIGGNLVRGSRLHVCLSRDLPDGFEQLRAMFGSYLQCT